MSEMANSAPSSPAALDMQALDALVRAGLDHRRGAGFLRAMSLLTSDAAIDDRIENAALRLQGDLREDIFSVREQVQRVEAAFDQKLSRLEQKLGDRISEGLKLQGEKSARQSSTLMRDINRLDRNIQRINISLAKLDTTHKENKSGQNMLLVVASLFVALITFVVSVMALSNSGASLTAPEVKPPVAAPK